MSDKNINSETAAVEQLEQLLAPEKGVGEDNKIISNMTYSDYLSAVYSYEEKARKKAFFDRKLMPLKHLREEKNAELQTLKNAAEFNRLERERIYNEALNEQKKKWEKTRNIINIRIAHETDIAKQKAEADINKRKKEYLDEIKEFNGKVIYLKDDISRLEKELKEIIAYRDSFDDYSVNSFPVADKEVLEILKTARNKRWLTPYHKELLQENANKICDKRIHDFDELVEREREFAHSEMIEEIKKGEVTKEVISEFAMRGAVFAASLTAFLSVSAVIFTAVKFLSFVQAATSCLFAGGIFLDIGKRIAKKKIKGINNIKKAAVSAGTFCIGSAVGFIVWLGLLANTQSIFAFLYSIISAAGTGFLIRQTLSAGFLEKYLKKLPFLRNRARYYVFKNSVKKENGKYNLQIYCYLNHDLVTNYLSIRYKDKITSELESKIELNRNIYKKDKSELAALSAYKKEILEKRKKLKDYVKIRNSQLEYEIRAIESDREDAYTSDFDSKLPQNVSSDIIKLDAEYENLRVQIENMELTFKRAEKRFYSVNNNYIKILEEYQLIEAALRYWYKTPMPSATDYRLLDSMCFESNKQLSIIHHNLQPFAFRYTVNHREISPSKSLKITIFRYIRGLIKINPCRMMQINIVDPVSDPKLLLEEPLFKRLSSVGVINGVCSLNDFEIRLFSNERNYNTFRSVFKSQCVNILRLLKKNSDKINDGELYSVELANRIKNDENEPFMYQIMMFIVPRAFDQTDFEPPVEIVKTMENGTYLNMGLLPVFFVDNDSVHEKWKSIVEMCPEECVVNQGKNKH